MIIQILMMICIAWSSSAPLPHAAEKQMAGTAARAGIRIHIAVVADSLNVLRADVHVAPGTNARDLMVRLFQVEFADRGRKFVKSIAGFPARALRREYWALEVNGEYAKAGIAELELTGAATIVWHRKQY